MKGYCTRDVDIIFHAFSEGFSYYDGYRFCTKSAAYAECKDYERNMFLE